MVDLDGDGLDDVVVPDLLPSALTTLVNRGPVGFVQTDYAVSDDPLNGAGALDVADFDGDGVPDVSVHAGYDANTGEGLVAVLLGTGSGTLQPPADRRTLGGERILEAADFNGDGRVDIATVGSTFDGSAVLLGDGAGGFADHTPIEDGDGGIRGTSADFDADGRPDLIVGDNGGTSLQLNTSD